MLEGERVRLRPIDESDLERMVAWRNAARDTFLDNRPITLAGQRAWYSRYRAGDERCFAIETKDGRPIGMVCLYHVDRSAHTAEFGRLIIGDDRYAGRGFAADASRALLRFAAEHIGIERVYLQVRESNTRAATLYRRLGFQEDASLGKVVERPDGTTVHVVGMSLDLPRAGVPD